MTRAVWMALVLTLLALPAFAVPDGWHANLDEGKKAARLSGKPILVVTAWKPKI